MNLDPSIMQKAEVLIEALPYIQRFNRKIIVVKYGGSAMVDEELKKHVIQDVVLLKLVGFKPIIVHGGGKEISSWISKAGMTPKFVGGLRVTDEATMEIAEMVLNRVNKSLVQLVNELGVKAVGISGKDGQLLKCERKYAGGQDIGFDDSFQSYNINADDAACAVARAVKAEKLAFLTDVEGLYRDFEDKSSLISEITAEAAQEMVSSGMLGGGMLPKLQNCIDAIGHGVSRVHILDGRIPHCLLLEIFTKKGIGTAILGNGKEKVIHE